MGYEGEFKNGKRDGYGTFTNYSGKQHIGYWKKNLRHGLGIEKLDDSITEACWHEGDIEGHGFRDTKCGWYVGYFK